MGTLEEYTVTSGGRSYLVEYIPDSHVTIEDMVQVKNAWRRASTC
jgi:hypothetical protein